MTDPAASIAFNDRVGARLKRLRQALGMTQAELAQELTDHGLSFQQQTILKVERGSRPLKLEEAAAIAEILGVTPADLSEYNAADEAAAAAAQKANALNGIARCERQKAEIDREIAHYRVLVREAERRLAAVGGDGRH